MSFPEDSTGALAQPFKLKAIAVANAAPNNLFLMIISFTPCVMYQHIFKYIFKA
jgi:hypothetical protein